MIPITRHGWREIIIGTILLAVIGMALGWLFWPLSFLAFIVWIWLISFFRDPERPLPPEQHTMVSPADGKVSDITELPECELLGGVPAIRVGIFLSVFNVHVNRAPCDGRVVKIIYKHGKFINAMHHNQASEQNESNTIVLAEPAGDRPVAVVKQIVGLIARRIVCAVHENDTVQRGQRIGMIKFGSRTELYIPKWLEPQIRVQIGQAVRGTADVIAVLGKGIEKAPTTAAAAGSV